MKKASIVSVAVIAIAVIFFGVWYLAANGAYHTTSNIAWQASQAHAQGMTDETNQIFSLAALCGQKGPSAVVVFIGTSTRGAVCYP
jgi:hypothetical protein